MHVPRADRVIHTFVELEKAGELLGRPIVSARTARLMAISNFARPPPEDEPEHDIFRPFPRPQTARKSVVRVLPALLDLAISFKDLSVHGSDSEDSGSSISSGGSEDFGSPSAALKGVQYVEPLFLEHEPMQLEIWWSAFPYRFDSYLGKLFQSALEWRRPPPVRQLQPATARPSLPPPTPRGRARGRSSRIVRPSSSAEVPRGRGRGRGRRPSPPSTPVQPAAGEQDCTGQTPFVFPVGWLGYRDTEFFTRGGGMPSLHLELRDSGWVPEWPSAIQAKVNGFGPRWVYLDRHSGVSLAGPLALGKSLQPRDEGFRGWECVPWKGERRGYTYQQSVTIPITFFGNPDLNLRVWCAFINSFGPTVILGRDFVLAHAVWVEFDGVGRPFRVHIRGQAFPCEPAERAWPPRR